MRLPVLKTRGLPVPRYTIRIPNEEAGLTMVRMLIQMTRRSKNQIWFEPTNLSRCKKLDFKVSLETGVPWS
jgi:hypothetical protein